MDHRGEKSWHRHRKGPALIDVRRLREYAAGHPEGAYNVPYPHVINKRDQDDDNFIDEVYRIVHGDSDRQIMLLCRTGSRSVDAGNLLAEAGFTHVQNIWEGFVGQYKYADDGGSIAYETDDEGNIVLVEGKPVFIPLDLNNDGERNQDMADVYEETADYNPDKDGWRNFMKLAWTKKLQRELVYEHNIRQYFDWMTLVSKDTYDKYRRWSDD